MKLLITGGSGTLGQKITKLALSKNYQVNILTRNKKLSSNESGLEYFYWNPSLSIIDDNCFLDVDSIIKHLLATNTIYMCDYLVISNI